VAIRTLVLRFGKKKPPRGKLPDEPKQVPQGA